MYLHSLEGLPTSKPCADNPFAPSPTSAPGYLKFSALHEILHAHGIVSDGAPRFTLNGHVSDSPSDLIYAGPNRRHHRYSTSIWTIPQSGKSAGGHHQLCQFAGSDQS